MFECSVCGLHFISGASCPSCGSTVAKDLEQGEELPIHDSESMPGLEELAESIGDEPFEDETPQSIETTLNLPFGMGAESAVSVSSLPFGIGSNASEVDDEQSSIPAAILMVQEVAEIQTSSETEPKPEPVSEAPESLEQSELEQDMDLPDLEQPETKDQMAVQPENTLRYRWSVNTLAIWDNRCTWHYAVNDYHGERRLMHRVTLEGVPLTAATG